MSVNIVGSKIRLPYRDVIAVEDGTAGASTGKGGSLAGLSDSSTITASHVDAGVNKVVA